MTLNEFKAWLEGYEASISAEGPTYTQWQVIKEKLATVVPLNVSTPAPHPLSGGVMPYKDNFPKIWYGAGDDAKMMGGAR